MSPVRGRRPWPLVIGLLVAAVLLAALGDWQVHRLAWKEALITRAAQAATAPALPFAALPQASPAALEYRRVLLHGHYLPATTTLVTAVSDLGSGYWDMAVLADDRAGPVWVNRGFVPTGSRRDIIAAATPIEAVSVTGLVRQAEPGGHWPRADRPAADRWYNRDLAAMARVRQFSGASARLFVDAQAETPRPAAGAPVPGLTVLAFPNNHLSYAITWFALALMAVGGAVVVWRRAP